MTAMVDKELQVELLHCQSPHYSVSGENSMLIFGDFLGLMAECQHAFCSLSDICFHHSPQLAVAAGAGICRQL